ncbi:uncharacterized protein KY384_007418 [Bacidia gigantensis]|uniref:uncharacterized protein n=1 Tax=Bacidia gigantensis TaxID=2732470 RepID=UPI001D03C03C|nr:uncharacterized protein KY384_007418 [Bacidia gigantensis]KAG8528500.1 hypothetical protein KY384_007418 [Bacidia gigantensis]
MVYRGKPSKACLQCRKRRLRDESHAAKARTLAKTSKLQVPATVAISLKARANSAFFTYYVSGFSQSYDVLEPLLLESSANSILRKTVDAVSLAFFSTRFCSSQGMRNARAEYISALSLLNATLQTAGGATSDSALVSIILLDLFEKITDLRPRSTGSWMMHVNGALAVVKIRGLPQLESKSGLRISSRIFQNSLISCIAANAAIPLGLVELRAHLERFVNPTDPKWLMSGLCVEYANLQSVIQSESLTSAEVARLLVKLDLKFVDLEKYTSSIWDQKPSFPRQQTHLTLEDYCHVYPDHVLTQQRNGTRIIRILLNDLLRKMMPPPPISDLDTNYATAGTIDSLAEEICISATQASLGAGGSHASDIDRIRCFTLIFPLYVAGTFASSTSGVKPLVLKQLSSLSDVMGLQHAAMIADVLRKGRKIDTWSVYALLGSYAFAA